MAEFHKGTASSSVHGLPCPHTKGLIITSVNLHLGVEVKSQAEILLCCCWENDCPARVSPSPPRLYGPLPTSSSVLCLSTLLSASYLPQTPLGLSTLRQMSDAAILTTCFPLLSREIGSDSPGQTCQLGHTTLLHPHPFIPISPCDSTFTVAPERAQHVADPQLMHCKTTLDPTWSWSPWKET